MKHSDTERAVVVENDWKWITKYYKQGKQVGVWVRSVAIPNQCGGIANASKPGLTGRPILPMNGRLHNCRCTATRP